MHSSANQTRSYPLQKVHFRFILLSHFQCICNFCGSGYNLCIQLPTFGHKPLFVLSGLYQHLDKLLVLPPDLAHTFIPNQLVQNHLKLLNGLRGVVHFYPHVLERHNQEQECKTTQLKKVVSFTFQETGAL